MDFIVILLIMPINKMLKTFDKPQPSLDMVVGHHQSKILQNQSALPLIARHEVKLNIAFADQGSTLGQLLFQYSVTSPFWILMRRKIRPYPRFP